MPSPIEGHYGLQLSALSRMLKAAQVIKNIVTYQQEKTGGRQQKAIHLIAGVTQKQINDAIAIQRTNADVQGLLRYLQPLIVSSVDPKASIELKTLELAGLPEGWNEEVTWKHYISIIAMAFLTDYQEFAPLPGGNLGTSAQSEVLHQKSRGKGPGLFMKLITHAMNFKILPKNVEFKYLEQDLEQEKAEAETKKLRAEERKTRLDSGEISIQEARQMAMDDGDLAQELFEAGGGSDLTTNTTVDDEEQPESQSPTQPNRNGNQPPPVAPQPARVEEGQREVAGQPAPFWVGRGGGREWY